MTNREIADEIRRHALRGAGRPVDLPSNEAYWEVVFCGWGPLHYNATPTERKFFLLFVAESLS